MYSVEPATRPAAEMVTIVRPFPPTAEAEEDAEAEEAAEFEEAAEASVAGASEAEAAAASTEGAGAPPDGCPGGFEPVVEP